MSRKRIASLLPAALAVAAGSVLVTGSAAAGGSRHGPPPGAGSQGLHAAGTATPMGGHGHGMAGSLGRHLNGTATPIKHVVVIFQENVSYDHYFGTYPKAANTDGQPFATRSRTPPSDGLPPATSPSLPPNLRHATDLLTSNPNTALPQRLDSSVAGQLTCDQDHNYADEQTAFDGGKMDLFVQTVGTGSGNSPLGQGHPCQASQVMDYYDGNTVTGLWNYAQHFAMSDNSYNTTFGPSSPGAISLASGDTGGVDAAHEANSPSVATPAKPNADLTPDGQGGFSLTSDAQPYWDDCSTRDAVGMTGQNIGDVLNQRGVSWGWFEGGFRPSTSYSAALQALNITQGTSKFTPDQFKAAFATGGQLNSLLPANASNQTLCSSVHPIGAALGGTGQYGYKDDYIPHHEPFQYYPSTANPHHLSIPTDASGNDSLPGLQEIGRDTQSYQNGQPQFDTPNHNYDTSDFDQLVSAIGRGELPPSALPAVSFLKAPGYQDGHAAYSDPADEQQFIVREINALQRTPDWRNTAVIVNYDDSDGWYDHQFPGIQNPSLSPADNLTDTKFPYPTSGQCGPSPQAAAPLAGEQGRCGFGPRLPMMVISPLARKNYIDHNLSDQASIINLIEYNWGLPGISGSADQLLAGTDQAERVPFDLAGMFHFAPYGNAFGYFRNRQLVLDPSTGQPVGADHTLRRH